MKTKMNGNGPRNALVENSFTGGDESVTVHSSSLLAKGEEISIDDDGDDGGDDEEGSAIEREVEREDSNRFSSSSISGDNSNNDGNGNDNDVDSSNSNTQLSAIAVGNSPVRSELEKLSVRTTSTKNLFRESSRRVRVR